VQRRAVAITDKTVPGATVSISPRAIGLESFVAVTGSGDVQQERLWKEYVERYHYLGYGVPVGPHIKYFVTHGSHLVACLAFAGAAWRVEARDRWIGWSKERRESDLRFIVNNTRFLIMPWIKAPNLASRVLALAARRLPEDWLLRYAYRPLLLETFVDIERHTGACYRAANWVLVGQTKGRGKMDRHFKADQPRKAVFVYPLAKDATDRLRAG